MRDDIISRREVMASLVAEYNRRYSEGGLKLAWIEEAVNDTPELWISVEERLPEEDVNVLVFAEGYADGFIGDTVTAISKRYIFRLFPWCDGELK